MFNRFLIALSVSAIVALSFLRESVFENINGHMWYLYYYNDKSYLPSYLSFLKQLSYNQLYWSKWGLTAFFSLLFLSFSCLLMVLVFKEKKFIRWTIYSYLAVVLVAAMAYLGGALFNNAENGYLISRFFMGMVQSPFLLIFLIPAFKLVPPKEESHPADGNHCQI